MLAGIGLPQWIQVISLVLVLAILFTLSPLGSPLGTFCGKFGGMFFITFFTAHGETSWFIGFAEKVMRR
jgi:hypothetical protein